MFIIINIIIIIIIIIFPIQFSLNLWERTWIGQVSIGMPQKKSLSLTSIFALSS